MSLQAGHKLAHYEILEPIGRGGMGEVYRAKDSKLGRDVAIKVLPDEFAQDEERLRRFQREAKVLASLNHPNIAAIYGLEKSGETHYLVLELVPGETLAERIARGPIPVDEAIAIATKIGEALEEAHEQGIVHRDLKPANVKIAEDDKVKILDFGLAKAFVGEEGAGIDSSQSPTLTKGTALGAIMGTAAYMSPEQARSKPIDKRTDLWAFGVVLYEALTGKRPFLGEDTSQTLGVRADISLSRTGTLAYLPAMDNPTYDRELVWVDADGNESRATAARDGYVDVAVSPDGKRVAVDMVSANGSGGRDVWILDIERQARTRLTFEGGEHPVWAPDSRIVFFATPGIGILSRPADGSTSPQTVVESPDAWMPDSFTPDGKVLAYSTRDSSGATDIWTLSFEDGHTEPLLATTAREEGAKFSPDGKLLAYVSDESGTFEVYVQPISGSRRAGADLGRGRTRAGVVTRWLSNLLSERRGDAGVRGRHRYA